MRRVRSTHVALDGARLAFYAQVRKIRQSEIARSLGVDKSLVSRWKTGTKPVPAHRFRAICSILNVPETFLMPPSPADCHR